jgi:hypothetical protein
MLGEGKLSPFVVTSKGISKNGVSESIKKRELEKQLFSRSDSASNIRESLRMNVPGNPNAAAAPNPR